MYSKKQQDILNFLKVYLKETPLSVIQEEVNAISAIPFVGATADHYFANFHKYYHGEAFDLPKTIISAKVPVPPHLRASLAEILIRINYNLFLGHFELDFTDGEIRFKTTLIYADAKVTPKMIDSFITSNIAAIDAYFELLSQFVTGKLNASEMVAKIK